MALGPHKLFLTAEEQAAVLALEAEVNAALEQRYEKEGPMEPGDIRCIPISVQYPLPKVQAELIRQYLDAGWQSASFDILPDGPSGSSFFDLTAPL